MKHFTFTKKSVPVVIETVLLFLLLFLKSARVSTDILKLGQFVLPVAMFSVVIFAVLSLLIRLGFRRDHIPVCFGLYTLVSVFLLIDAVYCGYTGKLPSIVMLRYTGQLGDVSSAIFENVTFSRLLYAIDIPLWILYFVHFRKKIRAFFGTDVKNGCPRASAVTLGIIGGLAVTVTMGYCIFTSFAPAYFKNEILSYHVLDIINVLFPSEDHVILDGTLLPENLFGDDTDIAEITGTTEPGVPDDTGAVTAPSTDDNEIETGDTTEAHDPGEEPSIPVIKPISPYYGIANGYNVMTIQLEAFQNFVIGAFYNGQELTPNLNALLRKDTLYFENYYYQIGGGNTADAEFAVNNSLYAPDTVAAYEVYRENDYYAMPTLLKENGYGEATAFHAYFEDYWFRHVAYPGQGFDTYLSGSNFYAYPYEVAGMGASDGAFFNMAVDYLAEQNYDDPFYAFMVTLTSHYDFKLPAQFQHLTLDEKHVGTLFGNYLQAVHYVDDAIGQLIDALKEHGMYENTIITLYGDHFGLPVYDWKSKMYMEEWLGKEYTYEQHFNVPLIMHIPGCDMAETISVTGGHIDVMPTLLHVLGLENKKGIMFGQNLLTAKEGIVYQQTHLARGSFISDTVLFQYPFNGIEVYAQANAIGTWEELDASKFLDISKESKKKIEQCMYLLDNNLVLIENYKAALEK